MEVNLVVDLKKALWRAQKKQKSICRNCMQLP